MGPLGLFPVFVAMVKLSLIQDKAGVALGAVLMPNISFQVSSPLTGANAAVHSNERERRELLTCSKGQYPHPDGTHCCMKCHKGTYVAEHCSGPDKATNCSVCQPGAYMPEVNYLGKCFGCSWCRSSFGQIIISSCTSEHNTVCGCEKNQYQTKNDSEFYCKNCSSCQNGIIRHDCTKLKDTICECHHGFFLQTDENYCLPCTSCNKPDCKQRCEAALNHLVKNPSNSLELTSILSSLVAILGAGCVLLLAKRILKQSCQKKEKASFGSYPLVPESKEEPISKTADFSLLVPPVVTQQLTQTCATASLPDCVRSAGERQIPDRPEVFYTVVEQVPPARWKEFIRYLGVNENVVERITMEQRFIREAQYEMLKHWRLQAGQDATVERISNVLNQMELNGCSEAIQEALAKQH